MEIGIIGAGAAGAGTAYGLRDAGADVTILEKSREVGGRAATRSKRGCVYDHGANYVTPDPDLEAFLRECESDQTDERLVEIDEPVWTFDADGTVSPGEERDRPALTYADGIARFAGTVLERTDATLELETRVESIARERDRWRIEHEEGRDEFDALVLTPPAPRTAALLADADWEDPLRGDLVETVESVPYRTILSVILHYPFELDRPYYTLVNTDRDHGIGWCSREGCKASHVPEGESLLVAQMAPDWSLERYGEPDARIASAAAELVGELLDDPQLASPDWTDCGRWRHALPDDGADTGLLHHAGDDGLFFAGDWVAGEGRVTAAFESGRELSHRLAYS
ncbi:NAD(P)/FAD-dependent oxidoreductase [Halalkalicoccus subterraneus]|uniref:NAD(P)/FAD-dependent oxidoreductase n=1 Tax=Halalkalicoccus subterraneus TaxID=2675002 RepID=UPI000EFD8B47|nr:FAD-dependent oxidoreductase [Halalkalicoccus subterraneus]